MPQCGSETTVILAYCYFEVAHNMPLIECDKKCLGDIFSHLDVAQKMHTYPVFFVADPVRCVLVMHSSLFIGIRDDALEKNCSLLNHIQHETCREHT